MTGMSFGLESYDGSLHLLKPWDFESALSSSCFFTMLTSNSKEKERSLSFLCCWYLGRRRVAMLLLLSLAFVVFVLGSYTINKGILKFFYLSLNDFNWNMLVMMPAFVNTTESNSPNIHQSIETMDFGSNQTPISRELTSFYTQNSDNNHIRDSFMWNGIGGSDVDVNHPSPSHHHPCDSFSFPPPPPPGMRRPGPRRMLFLRFNCFCSDPARTRIYLPCL